MKILDTREQKSPRFLIDAIPEITIAPLEVGDYLTAEKINQLKSNWKEEIYQCKGIGIKEGLKGHLVEIKIGKDFGIHTEQLERFQDELCRMAEWRRKNPHVVCHAVWLGTPNTMFEQGIKLFNHNCFKYHIWGHIVKSREELIKFLKSLDQPSKYVEFEPFIKRPHGFPDRTARIFRAIKGVSTEKAVEFARAIEGWHNMYDQGLTFEAECAILDVFGETQEGDPTALAQDLLDFFNGHQKEETL